MREAVLTVLSLSLSGSLVALVLHVLGPFFRRYLSRTWRYYIWLLVLARLLLPLGPQGNLMQVVGERMGGPVAQPEAPVQAAESDGPLLPPDPDSEALWESAAPSPLPPAEGPAPNGGAPFSLPGVEIIGIVWLGVAGVLVLRKITSYIRLVGDIKQSATPCEDAAALQLTASLCRELHIPLQPPVYINTLVPSPMLVGIVRPCVVLPADSASPRDLRYVLHHELVHFKRKDILYKWAAQLAVCIHWFNPVVRLVQREIGRCCELACDEAVIRHIGKEDRGSYGEAILAAVKPAGTKAYASVSLSMSEDKRALKERLIAIMGYQRRGRWAAPLAAVLTAVLLCGATYAGAYTQPRPVAAETRVTDLNTATVMGNTWYLIDTEKQLRGLGKGAYPLDGKYLLNADITLNKAVDWIPIGTQQAPFTGTFNGNGYKIVDLTITDPTVQVIGMFAYAENADIYNVTLRNPDIESAFTAGNSIGPILVLGKNCNSYDNQIIDPVQRDTPANKTGTGAASTGYTKRVESLIQDFAPYASHGVHYNPASDTVTYNGAVVKLFAVFKSGDAAADVTYAFDLLYRDKSADSNLYLEAVRNREGSVVEIRRLDAAIAEELLLDLQEASAPRSDSASKPDSGKFRPYNFNATFNWLSHGISATDKFDKGDLGSAVTTWLSECDKQQGAYILKTQSGGRHTTYLYYNGGGRYPWDMSMEDGALVINLYSDSPLVSSDGYHLMYFTAPQDYSAIKLYLDGTELRTVSQ